MRKTKSRSKYNVSKDKTKREFNGIVFDSEVEMRYYRDVVIQGVKSGDIVDYDLQKKYILQPKFKYEGKTILPIEYVADFFIKYKDGSEIVIDIKGNPDAVAKLKKKMFHYHYPTLNYVWITESKIDGGWCDYDYVQKQRKIRKKAKQN